jgi:hypothetical protein
MLQAGGESTLWTMVANDVTDAAARRRKSTVKLHQLGHIPASRRLAKEADIPAIDPVPGMPLLPPSVVEVSPAAGMRLGSQPSSAMFVVN